MTLALSKAEMEDAEQWLAANSVYCVRYQARLSMTACDRNRSLSAGDLRCEGCGGLHDQPPPLPALRLVSDERGDTESGAKEDRQSQAANDEPLPAEETEDLSFLDDLVIELSGEQLEEFCPGLPEELAGMSKGEAPLLDEAQPPARLKREAPRRKVAVFLGRCLRCGGYMINDQERQFDERDEEVYRCFSCGWRISPVYVFNCQSLKQGGG